MSHDDHFFDDTRPNKSERKREVQALTDLGRQLIDLPASQLAELPVTPELVEAIKLAQKIKSKPTGFNRQVQYIGKLIRNSDSQALLDAMELRQQAHLHAQQHFHQLEQWRDRLLAEGDDALHELMQQWPQIDRQHLRHLIRTAQKQQAENKPPAAQRELFKYLRSISQT